MSETSWIEVAVHALSEIEPVWPSVVVAEAFVNLTLPKSESVTVRQ